MTAAWDIGDDLTPNEEKALADLVFELSSPHTPEEIAERIGCTARHVRRIEARALLKLRAEMPAGWDASLIEPTSLHRRCGDVFAGDGSAPKREEN